MPDTNALARHFRYDVNQLLHRYVFGRPDIRRAFHIGVHEIADTVDHVVHVCVRADRGAITPNLDGLPVIGFGYLTADGRRGLLPPAIPSPFRSVAVLEPRNPNCNIVPPSVRHRHSLCVQLFPTILVVGHCRIGLSFRELRFAGHHVSVDANRG